MNYLKYIERSAENLQFYLWLRSYTKRFNELPKNEMALSPEWHDDGDTDAPARSKRVNPEAAAIFQGTDFANGPQVTESDKVNPFFTPPQTPNSELKREGGESMDFYDASMASRNKTDHAQRAVGAFESAGLKWKPRKSCRPSCQFRGQSY